MCYIFAHDKKQLSYEYDESSIGDKIIPKHVTTGALEALSDTFNFIKFWLKQLEDNYDTRRLVYSTDTK